MNNKLKLLLYATMTTGLIACWNDVGGNTNTQKSLQKAVQNKNTNLATVQSDTKGGVIIKNIPTVSNQDVVIKLTPLDIYNESRYIKDSLPFIGKNNYNSLSSILMPHRTYKVQVEDLKQGELLNLYFKKANALGDVLQDSVPPIFAQIMKTNNIFSNSTYSANGMDYYSTNYQDNNSDIKLLNNNLIAPFYAGDINIVNERGEVVALIKVGEYTNPAFENDLVKIAKHPLLGNTFDSSEGYKFSVSDYYVTGGNIYSSDKSDIIDLFNHEIQQMRPQNVLKAEGRYWPDNLFSKWGNKNINSRWVDFFKTYSNFTTTLPVPIDFVVEEANLIFNANRYCVTNIFYAYNGIDVNAYSFKEKNGSSKGFSLPIGRDSWGSANCFYINSNMNRADVGMISDYERNGGEYNKSMRFGW